MKNKNIEAGSSLRAGQFFPITVRQFLAIYLLVLIIFSVFRGLLFITEAARINQTVRLHDILMAFGMGLRFDIVISGYILIFPFLVLSISSFFKRKSEVVIRVVFYFVYALFTLAFLVCAVDIPYFNQFFSRFSVTAFEWIDSPEFVFKMIVQEPRYWLAILPFLLVSFLFYKLLKGIFSKFYQVRTEKVVPKILLSVLFFGLIGVGIRGRIEEKSPIRVGTAYFSNNAFLNQLGLNPNFTLIRSYLDSRKAENRNISLMNDAEAIRNVQQYLNIREPDQNFPLLRVIKGDTAVKNPSNVVVVIMESMSAAKMGRNGNQEQLTPFLDSLSRQGIYFTNAYTAGIHTMNGIFSTLFSFPALFRKHPMKESSMVEYHGLFRTLKEKGYSTIYFTTHDGQFDNVEGFLRQNDCETVVSKPDYPGEEVKTTLGVPDDFMFRFSIPRLNELSKKNKPFVAALMTASDHGPYFIPDYFKPHSKDAKKQIIEYADYSLRTFINLASRQDWFKNTVFVFVADHGAPIDGTYDMSLDYNHTPLIFYAPHLLKEPATMDQMAGQIDVFPSIMGLLGLPYENNTLGIDLFHEKRPWIFFGADDKYGVINGEWLLIVRNDRSMSLYKYRNKDTHNYATERRDIAGPMNEYAESNLQAYQYVLKNNKQ